MKKLLRLTTIGWCALCGLAVPPLVLAVVIAQAMGVLDLHPIVDKIQGNALEGDAEAGVTHAMAGIPAGDFATPIDAFAWRRRLLELGTEVDADSDRLATIGVELEARDAAQMQVAESLAALLGDLLGAAVSAAELLENPGEWRRRVAARRDTEALRPRLLKLIQNVDNEALASIFVTPVASNGLDEDTVTRLMEELPPARAGEVITELGRRDPALAARIIARLERSTAPLDSEDEPPR